MIQMFNNCEKRGPEGPKRFQYGPKAPLGASGGVLGRARGQKLRFCVICWVPFGAQHRPKIDIGGFEKYWQTFGFYCIFELGGSRGRLGRRLKTDPKKEAAVSAGMAAGADPAEGGEVNLPWSWIWSRNLHLKTPCILDGCGGFKELRSCRRPLYNII